MEQRPTAGHQSVSSTDTHIADHGQPLLTTQPGPMLPAPIQRTVDRSQMYKTHIYRLANTEIVLGVLSIIFTIPTLAIVSSEAERYLSKMSYAGYRYSYRVNTLFTYAAAGFWGGICIVTLGILGLRIRINPSRVGYIGSTIMAIMTANITSVATTVDVLAAGDSYYSSALTGLHIALALINAAATISAIVHSALCCCGACRVNDTAAQQPVMYFPTHGNALCQPQYIQGPNGQLMTVMQPVTTQSTQFVDSGYPVSPYTAGPPPPMANTHYPARLANSGYPAPRMEKHP